MRIGYFGGSFDPPHRGHLAVARLARDRFALDRVLLAPTARQPLKRDGPQASWPDRLRMTELLCAGEPALEASSADGPQPGDAPNYTVDTLRRLRTSLPPGSDPKDESASSAVFSGGPPRRGSASPGAESALQLFAILGADAFLGLRHWREPEELFRLADWIVASRPGFSLDSVAPLGLTPAQLTHMHPLDSLADPVSATALRKRLQARENCRGQIPDPVLEYILKNHLYGS